MGECSPFIVDRVLFSMGSGDEVDGHLDDHEISSTASSELVDSIDSSEAVSSLHSQIEDDRCSNCHSLLEKMLLLAYSERFGFIYKFIMDHFDHEQLRKFLDTF